MDLLDLFFPKKCVGCGKLGNYVCEACKIGMWEEEQICPICRRNSRYGSRHKYCHQAWGLDGLSCFWAYEGIAKKLIYKTKYKFFYDYLVELIAQSAELIDRPEYYELWRFLEQKPTIVPVPLHPQRLKTRGFNQSQIIGELLGKSFDLPVENLLKRVKNTLQQVGKSKEFRLKNLEQAFQITSLKSKVPKSVLLIDDVWTTGATMSECARTLKQAGVKQIWGLVLAR